jgi:S1-C subfamily serine protease
VPRALARHHGLTADRGVKVLSLEAGEPAAQAGVVRGDVIVSLDGQPVTDVDDLQRLLGETAIGRSLRLGLLRLTEKLEIDLVPHESA